MITADTITQTVHKLGQLFLRSYQSGQQSRDLQAENATAFGQFLDQLRAADGPRRSPATALLATVTEGLVRIECCRTVIIHSCRTILI